MGVDAILTMTWSAPNNVILGGMSPEKVIFSGSVKVTGRMVAIVQLVSVLDKPEFWFNIATR